MSQARLSARFGRVADPTADTGRDRAAWSRAAALKRARIGFALWKRRGQVRMWVGLIAAAAWWAIRSMVAA